MVDTHTHLKRARSLSHLMDNHFSVGPIKFGLDPLVGLIPVIGDWLPIGLSVYMLWIGYHMGLPTSLMGKMIGFTLIDVCLGTIPIFGDLADFVYQSHTKNLHILTTYAHNS